MQALIPFVFTTLGLHRIEAACLPENEPRSNLLAKPAFAQEGLARRYLLINGEWGDHSCSLCWKMKRLEQCAL